MPRDLEKAVAFIKREEALRLRAYPDPIYGWLRATIGYGTTVYPNGNNVKKGDTCTEAQADEYLLYWLTTRCKPKLEAIPNWRIMNHNQKAALYSFAYNLGERFYGRKNFSSITSVCNIVSLWDDKEWIKSQFVKYRNPGSQVEAGLMKRRAREAALFCAFIDEEPTNE